MKVEILQNLVDPAEFTIYRNGECVGHVEAIGGDLVVQVLPTEDARQSRFVSLKDYVVKVLND